MCFFSSQELTKSLVVALNQEVEPNLVDVSCDPLPTPWGSRSASPYPSLDTGEIVNEMPSAPDVEVYHGNSGFQPIPNAKIIDDSPGNSPSEGILPVGGVVKGHSLPNEKSESLARLKIESDGTSREVTGSLKAFVINPGIKEEKVQESPGGGINSTKETSRKEMAGTKEPDTVMTGSLMKPSTGKAVVVKGPEFEKVDDGKEPSKVDLNCAKDTSQVKRVFGEEFSSAKMACGNGKSFDEKVDSAECSVEGASNDVKTDVLGCDSRDLKTSSWYIEDNSKENNCETMQRQIQEESVVTVPKSDESEIKKKLLEPSCAVTTNPFILSHRRVASSPSIIMVEPFDNRPASDERDSYELTYLEKSRSDPDLRSPSKQLLYESQVSQKFCFSFECTTT